MSILLRKTAGLLDEDRKKTALTRAQVFNPRALRDLVYGPLPITLGDKAGST
jgi:hypothetical protein